MPTKEQTRDFRRAVKLASKHEDRYMIYPFKREPVVKVLAPSSYVEQMNANLHAEMTRARDKTLEATATILDWIKTIIHFDFMCAYCQTEPFGVIEHFLPIAYGGGTTKYNIVPACEKCNHQRKYTVIPGEDRVEQYLIGLLKHDQCA